MAEGVASNPRAQGDDPEEPHSTPSPRPSVDTDAREATELEKLRKLYSRASSRRKQGSSIASKKPTTVWGHVIDAIAKFWRRQVSITVAHDTCRDHLALERTFLAYLRTSLALSMIGITIAQLFRLQHAPSPDPIFGFYILGKPLACICQGAAMYTLFIGAFRTWRTQNAVVRGKAISGGIEIVLLAGGMLILLLLFFVVLVAIDVEKEDIT